MCDKVLRSWVALWLSWLLLASGALTVNAAAEGPVVHAVMFYSPSCGHCHHVIENVLPPLLKQYGEQFEIVGVNVADSGGQALYQATIEAFAIPPERRGVPTLVIGETVLVGSGEIPTELPGLIETYLAQGGLDWPAIPGLLEALAASAPTTTATPEATPAPTQAATEATVNAPTAMPVPAPAIPGVVKETWRDRFIRDPLGNGLSVLVLLGMLASVLYQGWALTRTPVAEVRRWQWAIIPPLVVLGLMVAGYLAYVETQQVAAVCGPVGDCNAVQQSEFALLFGFLPIAVLGVLGYVAIGAAWAVAHWARRPWAELAQLALVGMTCFGIAFSIYLTFLEPFVIGATCAWCLTSAIVMTALFWLVAPRARPALAALRSTAPIINYKENFNDRVARNRQSSLGGTRRSGGVGHGG